MPWTQVIPLSVSVSLHPRSSPIRRKQVPHARPIPRHSQSQAGKCPICLTSLRLADVPSAPWVGSEVSPRHSGRPILVGARPSTSVDRRELPGVAPNVGGNIYARGALILSDMTQSHTLAFGMRQFSSRNAIMCIVHRTLDDSGVDLYPLRP